MAGLKPYWQGRAQAALILCACALPVAAFAQDGQAKLIDVSTLTLMPLPNQSMANVKGGGLSGPGVGNAAPSGGAIILWDELKTPAQQQTPLSGVSTITINGVAK